jgi:MYXO-CTERM domain-containing protein
MTWILWTALAGATEVWYDDVDQDFLGNDFDQDGDGHASAAMVAAFAAANPGWTWETSASYGLLPVPADDCDDDNAAIQPGATEDCNGVDEDCDDLVDEPTPGFVPHGSAVWHVDVDADGYGGDGGDGGLTVGVCGAWTARAGDCPDGPAIPGASDCWSRNADDCNDSRRDVPPPPDRRPDFVDPGRRGRVVRRTTGARRGRRRPRRGLADPDTAPAASGAGRYAAPADLGLAPLRPEAALPNVVVHGLALLAWCDAAVGLYFVDTERLVVQGTVEHGIVVTELTPARPFNDCDDRAVWRNDSALDEVCDLADTTCARAFEGYVDTDGVPDPIVAGLPGATTETAVDVDADDLPDRCDPNGEVRWTADPPLTAFDAHVDPPDAEEDRACHSAAAPPAAWALLAGLGAAAARRRRR